MSFPDPFDPGAGQGYHVYPEKLRAAADAIADAAGLLQNFAVVELADVALGSYDLGLPGTATNMMPGLNGTGTVDRYNSAIDAIRRITAENSTQLAVLSAALGKAAQHYEQLDQEAYERLKKLEGEIK
ncbi:hypothetical protein [Amycolatopsis speibonae]|uniref:ESX-1 secretion-associated protein n=1 Tax=Amycolatopsis speibonae TaxID=1450224 RepID=A0ABV7NYK3_9PSEU